MGVSESHHAVVGRSDGAKSPCAVALLFGVTAAFGCAGGGADSVAPAAPSVATQGGAQKNESSCAARLPAPAELPGTPAELSRLSYWLDLYGEEAERPLLEPGGMRAHNAAMRFERDGAARIVDMRSVPSPELVQHTLEERLAFIVDRLESGKYAAEGSDALEKLRVSPQSFVPGRRAYVATGMVPLRCGPYLGPLTATEGDHRFDRNNCSTARPGEPVEVLGRIGDVRMVRTAFSIGFIADDAALSPEMSAAERALWIEQPRARLDAALRVGSADAAVTYEAGTTLPSVGEGRVRVATTQGFSEAAAPEASVLKQPVTRADVLREAFRYVGSPYGWGGQGGGRDCSRFLLDVFRGVGLELPRASVPQSQAGTFSVDIPEQAGEADRLSLLDEANARGVVLIHFPGHIMLYLGRDAEGTPRALHAFAEYLAPCDEGGETLYEVETVAVSDLSLGKGSSRRSFLERMTRVSVFGEPPGFALLALAQFRPTAPPPPVPKSCEDGLDVAMFRSPRVPEVGQPMRAIVSSTEDTRPAQLYLVDPDGTMHQPEVQDYGVGPFSRVGTLTPSRPGRWTMLLADGPRVVACERFGVLLPQDPDPEPRSDEDPAWKARWSWERDTENLYAAFVEALFSHPVDDARTWPSLSALLRDPERNLLFNHLGLDEDTRMHLEPDCADLPYFLRAYFAWKIDLPFGFRRCSRGRAGVPPRCGDLNTNEQPTPGGDAVSAFERFVLRSVRPGVHSASNRTVPTDQRSDMYPLPLDRRALRPGSVFNDPYGHLIVVAKWVPQGLGGQGMLLGADAQPDATVGRRRFWRGSFLFTPKTDDVGAGFKAFRPIGRLEPEGPLVAFDDDAIDASPHHPDPSRQQYEGSQADFYAAMDELIYPRPLEPVERIRKLVEALEEQVLRRVTSVDTGEEWMREHSRVMQMPDGYAIFETQGPWEDFATPSRDMRLLIAIETVLGLPELVAQHPARFGFAADAGAEARQRVEKQLREQLSARRFTYTNSKGEAVELTLADVVDRAEALEMAYNPNDCLELRWGAPRDSDEIATCERRAPSAQRQKMERYRSWFANRTRPARP